MTSHEYEGEHRTREIKKTKSRIRLEWMIERKKY